jgi:hypothetical protein
MDLSSGSFASEFVVTIAVVRGTKVNGTKEAQGEEYKMVACVFIYFLFI